METISQSKNPKKITAVGITRGQQHRGVAQKNGEIKLAPGKTIEQIHIEAVRQVRQMGIMI